jgi:hypothetical protein
MAETFEDFIARERDHLNGEREKIFTAQHELEKKLAAINGEMAAITAYENAKTGKAPVARGKKTGTRGSKRDGIMAAINASPGLTRGELLERLRVKGNKSGEMSVSNALTGLTKSGQVVRQDGKYRPAA